MTIIISLCGVVYRLRVYNVKNASAYRPWVLRLTLIERTADIPSTVQYARSGTSFFNVLRVIN